MYQTHNKSSWWSVNIISASPCLNDRSCTVDVNGEAVCACNGEWSGFYCSGLFYIVMYKQTRSKRIFTVFQTLYILKLNKVHDQIITKYTIDILTSTAPGVRGDF
jgi:hypothetical protein